jgi:hypothetical protein
LSIEPLTRDVIDALLKIDPGDRVIRAVLLGLRFSLKQAQLS